MYGSNSGRTVDVRQDRDAVDGVTEEHAIRHRTESSGLGRVEVDRDQPSDRQKRSSNREDTLDSRCGTIHRA